MDVCALGDRIVIFGEQGAVVTIGCRFFDFVNVAGNAGNPFQAAFRIDQFRQLVRRHVMVFHQVNHTRRVNAA